MPIRWAMSSWIALLAIAPESHAADRFWGNQFGGTFVDPFNWQDGLVPGAGDIAHFDLTTNPTLLQRIYTVSFTADATNQALKIEDDFVTFDLDGQTYTTTSVTGNEIGNVAGRSGRLTITDGIMSAALNSQLSIGAIANASGVLTVSTGAFVVANPFLFVHVGHLGTGTLTVENNGRVLAEALFIGTNAGATGTATITGDGSSFLTKQLIVGNQGSGTLNITAGGRLDNTGFGDVVGNFPGITGTVSVEGLNSQWNGAVRIVGFFGQGTLNISEGGQVRNFHGRVGAAVGGSGVVTVNGTSSRWDNAGDLTIGDSGSGNLNITAGGHVQNDCGIVGFNPPDVTSGGTGAVTVDGDNSQWINSRELIVGYFGQGTLTVTSGGYVQSTDAFVSSGLNSTGVVTVDGDNSQWTSFGELHLGVGGPGTLTITGGGHVQNARGFVGMGPSGEVRVVGDNSRWINSGDLSVGHSGPGTLTITSGGRVQNSRGFIGSFAGGTVTVSGAGSIWEMTGPLFIGRDPTDPGISEGPATLIIDPGGAVIIEEDTVLLGGEVVRLQGGTLQTRAISRFQGSGQFQWTSGVLHIGTFAGDLLNQGGVLAPGRSAGSTTIMGNYTQQTGGKLEIEIGGGFPGSTFDTVDVTGTALLDGGLQLKLINGFLPNPSLTLKVLSATSLSGVFTNVANGQRLTTVDGIGSFLVHYGPGSALPQNQIILTDFEFTPGDCDHDGNINLDDYAPLPDCLGGPDVLLGPIECGCFDLNADDDVDLSDFAAFQAALTGS